MAKPVPPPQWADGKTLVPFLPQLLTTCYLWTTMSGGGDWPGVWGCRAASILCREGPGKAGDLGWSSSATTNVLCDPKCHAQSLMGGWSGS